MILSCLHTIDSLDASLLVLLNGCNCPAADTFFTYVTDRFFWIPAYAVLALFLYKQLGKQRFLYLLLSILLMVICTDQLTSTIIKPMAHRMRPCHDPLLAPRLHLLDGVCGGSYGFVSSHAANTFALCSLLFMALGSRWKKVMILLFSWAAVVSFSRIYLGVHYPGDVIVGALIGFAIGRLFGYIYLRIIHRHTLNKTI